MIMVVEELITTAKILVAEITGITGAAVTIEATGVVAITGITEVEVEITGIIITEILRKDIDNSLTCLTADRLG